MKYQLKIETINGKTYVKCSYCNEILLTNDQEFVSTKVKRNELYSVTSCEHYEICDFHKDEKSLKDEKFFEKDAILKYEGKYYITLIVPRSS